jgi:molybdate transport system substrate-binding protein
MNTAKVSACVALGFCAAVHAISCSAAELLVWSAGAAKAPLSEIVEEYKKSSGNAVKVDYAPVGVLMRRLADGGKPDVLIVSLDVASEVERNGWSVAGSSTSVGSVGVGIAVKDGMPIPDISTPEALRKTLLSVKSITYMDPNKGTSGKHFASVLEQLGIADQVRAKTTLGDVGFVVEPVARGEVELGIQQITEILPVKGVQFVGPLPSLLQKITTYSIALGAHGSERAAARNFLDFVKRDSSAALFRAKGFSTP